LRGAERISWKLDDSPSPAWNAGTESLSPCVTAKSICMPGADAKVTPASRLVDAPASWIAPTRSRAMSTKVAGLGDRFARLPESRHR